MTDTAGTARDVGAPPVHKPIRCRPFTISDAMILVAATALSLAFVKSTSASHSWWTAQFGGPTPLSRKVDEWSIYWSTFAIPWNVAYLIIRLRRPRPGRGELARQPGFVACLAAALSMVVSLTYMLSAYVINGFPAVSWVLPGPVAGSCGFAVLGAWSTIWFGALTRFERGWIDTIGTVLGVGWMLRLLEPPLNVALRFI